MTARIPWTAQLIEDALYRGPTRSGSLEDGGHSTTYVCAADERLSYVSVSNEDFTHREIVWCVNNKRVGSIAAAAKALNDHEAIESAGGLR